MADLDVRKWPPLTRELGRRPRPDDYRAPARATMSAGKPNEGVAAGKTDTETDQGDTMSTAPRVVDLGRLQEQLSRKPLEEIAVLVCALTYGEMIELAEAIWNVQPEGLPITQDNLPALLHRWAKSCSAGTSEVPEPLRGAPKNEPARPLEKPGDLVGDPTLTDINGTVG